MRKNWQYKKLGEICAFDKRFNGLERGTQKTVLSFIHVSAKKLKSLKCSDGNIRLLSTGFFNGYTTREKAKGIINTGEVISIPSGGSANLKYHKGDFVDSGNILMSSIYPEVNLRYVFNYLLSINPQIESFFKGAGIKHPFMPDVYNLLIPIPSLKIQEQILFYIDEAFAKIDALKANAERELEEAAAFFSASLNEMIEPKEDWVEKKMDDICKLSQGLAINKTSKHLIVKHSTIPLLRIKDMKQGTREIFIDDKNYPPNCLANTDDLIYTRTGTLGLIFTGMFGIVHNNCFKIKLRDEIDKSFFMYFVSTEKFRNHIISIAERAAQPDITHKLFKAQKIHFPALYEQRIIVNKLDTIKSKVTQLQSNLEQVARECAALKQAILKQAFSHERSTDTNELN